MKHTLFIIFGSTGDLAKRKLFPALYEIFQKNPPEHTLQIIAVGRRHFREDTFRDYIDSETSLFIGKSDMFTSFLSHIDYQRVEVTTKDDYEILSKKIHSHSTVDTQIVIYLSIAPEHFTPFIENYGTLNPPTTTRVVFEKPFGTDLASSRILNENVGRVFQEDQIYRIDHYVGKEAIQNIFALRFANTIFEPIWNKSYIDNIQITASESIGVGSRGEYYDDSGALRDMVQNHLLQVLSLVIMDSPEDMTDESIRTKKLQVFRELKLNDNFEKSVVFGQYTGYLNEKGIAPNSTTETFIALKLEVANSRWEGVPIYLKTGKSLDKKLSQIVIEFRKSPYPLFQDSKNPDQNRIIIDIQPDETIRIEFNVKENGNSRNIRKVEGVFSNDLHGREAYEKLLNDVILGDKTLFTSFEMLEETWRIIDNLVHCKDNCPLIFPYAIGGDGPITQDTLLEQDGRHWYR